MGGRYQTAQVYLSGHGALKSGGADGLAAFSGIEVVDVVSFRMLLTTLLTGLSFFSEGVVGAGDDMAAALKSKAVPGVLGVFAAEPNEAKAPEPRPKADEPPVVGDARPPGVNGGMALKGLRPPCDESPPKRLVAETVRWCGSDLSLGSECDMESESLLVLLGGLRVSWSGSEDAGVMRAYLERRVQRLSLLSIGSSSKWVNNTIEEGYGIQGWVGVAREQGMDELGGQRAEGQCARAACGVEIARGRAWWRRRADGRYG